METCQICGRAPRMGYSRPHSIHRTKRKIYPNVQKIHGKFICMNCLRTQSKLGQKNLKPLPNQG